MADRIVQAKSSYATRVDDDIFPVRRGDMFLDSDPVVKANPEHFVDLTIRSSSKGRTTTTAVASDEGSSESATSVRRGRRAAVKPEAAQGDATTETKTTESDNKDSEV